MNSPRGRKAGALWPIVALHAILFWLVFPERMSSMSFRWPGFMNYKSLFSKVRYRGKVHSVKNDYHVLEGPQDYVVLSTNHQYTIVAKKAVNFIVKKLGGTKGISSSEAFERCKGSQHFPNKFSLLNAMYALIGTQQGKISKISGRTLYFNVWKGAA